MTTKTFPSMNLKDLEVITLIYNIAKNNLDGFTVDLSGKDITNGYSVGMLETQNSFGLKGAIQVLNVIKESKEPLFFGGWFNNDNGKFYFDAVKIYEDEKTAIQAGKDNNQISIFNLNTNKEIKL